MLYLILVLIAFGLTGVALFFGLKYAELRSQFQRTTGDWQRKEEEYLAELSKLEKLRHIPDIIERARRSKEDVEARLEEARKRADQILREAVEKSQERSRKLLEEGEQDLERMRGAARLSEAEASSIKAEARQALKLAKAQAQEHLDHAAVEARSIASKARKEVKEKREKAEAALALATAYALEIRQKAERRALEIAGEAFEAKGRLKEHQTAAEALRNQISGYEGTYAVPPAHVLDELAEEFGFSNAGEKLKLARERTRLMLQNGTAAACGYPEGWKKDHALKFVLSTFNGKVDTILSRIKPGIQGKLIQEIKDAYAQVNLDGEVYKNARIQEEFLDSRLEEVKWAAAVQKLKEKAREEQRAIKEQMREEARAKREIEKAIKQASREEELVNKAIAKLRKQFEEAGEAERARLEAQMEELNAKLIEAEEKGRKAVSMAQQTKKGNVYIISNIGAFGEDVFKIGLTRRLDPMERVRELGDASVPFPFDVHAMLVSDDAPALEAALHRRFVERQVNKINKRKEFFKVSLTELRIAAEEMGLEATWTLDAEATQYRETLALETAMKTDLELKSKWLEDQATFNFQDEEEADALEEELEEVEA